jgi:hypothetical protein
MHIYVLKLPGLYKETHCFNRSSLLLGNRVNTLNQETGTAAQADLISLSAVCANENCWRIQFRVNRAITVMSSRSYTEQNCKNSTVVQPKTKKSMEVDHSIALDRPMRRTFMHNRWN